MRRARSIVLALGALGATFVAAGDAPAASSMTGLTIGTCPAPSLAVCQAESGLTSTCATKNHAACVTVLKNEFQSEYAASSSRAVVPAVSTPVMTGAEPETTGVVLPYDQKRVAITGNSDATFAAQTAATHLPSALGLTSSRFGLAATRAPSHPAWEANGGAVTSTRSGGCAEYVYEKYYDQSQFEDAAATCLNDYSCIYDVGVLPATPGLAQPTLHRRDGGAMTKQLAQLPAVSQPKNAFFAVDPSVILSVLNQVGPGPSSDTTAALVQIANALPGFRYEVADRLAWHRQMHDGQAAEGLGATDYRAMEARQAAYAEMVASYQLAFATFPGDVVEGVLHGTYTTTCANGTKKTGILTTDDGGDPDNPCVTKRSKTKFAPGSQGAWLQSLVFKMAGALVAEWSHQNPVTQAVDHGCLDPNSTRCDWQPKAFARDYVGLWQKEREADYATCASDTGDDLVVDPTYEYAPTTADLASTPAMEAYFGHLEQLFAAETADVPWLTTTSGATSAAVPDTVGNASSGGHTIGDPAWFGANYSYDSMWQLHFGKTDTGQVCKADGEVRGKLAAGVSILNSATSVVDALFDMTAGRTGDDGGHLTTYFKLFGGDLYTPVDRAIGGTAGAWNLSKSTTIDGPHGSVTFPVLGVPVTIAGGANLRFGYDASADATAPQTCIPMQSDGSYSVLRVAGSLTPWAAVDAYVSGAVDAAVLSVGIDANLNLLTAKLPVSASLSLDFNDHNDAQVELDASTSLELSELSGSVDAFAKIDLGITSMTTDVQLFSWDGLHQKVPIYRFTKAYPLTAMNYALHRHGG